MPSEFIEVDLDEAQTGFVIEIMNTSRIHGNGRLEELKTSPLAPAALTYLLQENYLVFDSYVLPLGGMRFLFFKS